MLTQNWIYKIMHHLLLSDLDKEFLVHKGKSKTKLNIILDGDINGNLINFLFIFLSNLFHQCSKVFGT